MEWRLMAHEWSLFSHQGFFKHCSLYTVEDSFQLAILVLKQIRNRILIRKMANKHCSWYFLLHSQRFVIFNHLSYIYTFQLVNILKLMMDMVSIYHGTVSAWDDSETEYDYKFLPFKTQIRILNAGLLEKSLIFAFVQ